MENNRKLLSCVRRTRAFRANFEKLIALVYFNRIHIMTAGEFRVIDILEGHEKQIKCIDVSQISKVVVSFSQDLLLVHAPIKDDTIQSDHVISSGALKYQFLCNALDGSSNGNESKNLLAAVIKQKPLGNIIQQEVTNDGRMIICLEQRSKTLKIFYQDKLAEPKKEKKKEVKNVDKYQQQPHPRYGRREEKVDALIEFNPYANMDGDGKVNNDQEVKFSKEDLSEYQLPPHKFPIEYFKILYHDIYECEKRFLPNYILTVTSKNEVLLWQENLMNNQMQFVCVHLFRGYQNASFFDVSFLDFPPINPKRYVELKNNISPLFDTTLDRILKLKKEENGFGIYKQNYQETSYDWILVLNDGILEIFKIEGMRNFPLKSLNVFIYNRIRMSYNSRDFFGTCKIYSASCRDFNDILSLYTINSSGQLIKIRKDFKDQGLGKWKIDKLAILKRKTIEDVIVHKQLPFVAELINNTELYFYVDEINKNQIIKSHELKFFGAYSVYHTSKQQINKAVELRIMSAKWVKNLCQMVVHFNNNSLALVSSHTQLRILTHSKYQEEYLKIWEERRSPIAEKWEKLFEIQFDQGEDNEQIVDFEILSSKVIDGGFNIYLAVFTNHNQYLIYETETLIQSSLKTLSQYQLVYQKYSPDSLIKMLGTFNAFIDQPGKTVLALLSEVDPANQKQQAKEAPMPVVEEEVESEEDSDDGDIFASYNKPPKIAKPMLKKKPVEQQVVKEEPLRHMMLIKFLEFDEKSLSKKQHKEVWRVEVPMDYKSKQIKCKASQEFFGFMIYDGQDQNLVIYLYDIVANKYIGYLNVSQMLGIKGCTMELVDFIFTTGSAKGGITIYYNDNLYLLAQSSREGEPGKWSIIQEFENVVNFDKNSIKSSQIYETPLRKQMLIINKKHLNIKDKFLVLKNSDFAQDTRKMYLNQIYTATQSTYIIIDLQESFALYDTRLLKTLYVKGYVNLVLKVLVKLSEILKQANAQVSDYLDFDLESIVQEIQEQLLSSSQGQGKKKEETSSSLFDDFYPTEQPKKEEPVDEKPNIKQLEIDFEEGFKDFIINVRTLGKVKLGMDEEGRANFIDFIKRFHQTYRKEFFADNLTSFLLRGVYFDTEDVQIEVEEQKKEVSGRPFNVVDYINKLRSQPMALSKASLGSLKQWNSLQACMALHSEMQDVIMNELQERFDLENNLNYELMKRLCIPVWLKDTNKLKALVTTIAKIEYKNAGDDFNKSSRAEKTALWYILLDRKDMLIKLYKQEPQYKKVYELLLNDFKEQKWKTSAEKNAMVLLSKKNTHLSCAFFLLANNIKDAIKVALDKMNDPVLAVLIARMMEKENLDESKKEDTWLEKIYLENFIQRGEKCNDPYLQNIGRWQRKEFLKALNVFQIDHSKLNNVNHLFQSNLLEFNIFQQKSEAEEAKSGDQQDVVPLISKYDYYVLDFIKTLKKSTMVKRQIQSQWNTGNKGGFGGGFNFDDEDDDDNDIFSTATKKKQQTETKAEENKITVEEPRILEVVTLDSTQKGFSLLALVVMSENLEFIEKTEQRFKQLVANALIIDVVQSVQYGSISKLKQSVRLMIDRLELDEETTRVFVEKQFNYLDNFGLFVSYLIEEQSEGVMSRVEEESLKLIDFIHSTADYPFITDNINDAKIGFPIKKAISYLENLADSYMIVDYQQLGMRSKAAEPPVSQKNDKLKRVMTVTDPDNEDANYKISLDEGKGDINLRKQLTWQQVFSLDVNSNVLRKEVSMTSEMEAPVQNLSTKQFFALISYRLRTALLIYLALLQICFISRKFGMVKDLVADLKSIFKSNLAAEPDQNEDINIQKLKTQIQKFKYSLEIQEDEKPQENEFEMKMQNKSPTKDPEAEKTKTKINQFIILWMRYIISHYMHQLIRLSYEKSQVKNLIDIRPSIIKTRPVCEATEIILNSRLQSAELLKKFGNMDRILENVTTYYFENVLNLNERAIIANDLQLIQANLFNSEKKFTEFASFLDLGSFIKHLKDHELSLVYHKNVDCGPRTVERVQDLFQSGIDIFRLKGETVNAFTFDRCDLDLVSIAMLNKGIREIPIQKSLLYRNRHSKGHQVVDEECATWHECLHRFDKIALEHANIKPQNEAIIATVDKLYSYKTINYTKKMRRKRGTIFLDYEMSPPDHWSGMKSSDFMRHRSELDITHEDYSYAIESHPYLPLYVTGNARGLMCLWQFNQQDDRSIDQWVTESDQKAVNPKKNTIKKIQFNNYGDKIVCSSMEGSVFMYRVDTSESSKMMPVYQLRKSKEQKFNDFEILNYDTVLAMTSLKPKHIWIFDTLIHQKNGLVMESTVGGNIIQPYRSKSQLFVFNEKPGNLQILDLKMNKLINTLQLHTDEITSVTMNESENTLVAGFKDGVIKIFNTEKDFELREQYMAFTPMGAKKGSVSQVKIHPTNGALFAASHTGNFKIFRTKPVQSKGNIDTNYYYNFKGAVGQQQPAFVFTRAENQYIWVYSKYGFAHGAYYGSFLGIASAIYYRKVSHIPRYAIGSGLAYAAFHASSAYFRNEV